MYQILIISYNCQKRGTEPVIINFISWTFLGAQFLEAQLATPAIKNLSSSPRQTNGLPESPLQPDEYPLKPKQNDEGLRRASYRPQNPLTKDLFWLKKFSFLSVENYKNKVNDKPRSRVSCKMGAYRFGNALVRPQPANQHFCSLKFASLDGKHIGDKSSSNLTFSVSLTSWKSSSQTPNLFFFA